MTLSLYITSTDQLNFEKFITNPGLQHLAENIFVNLNYQDLKTCLLINK